MATCGDLNYSSVSLLCHADGTNGQTTFTDNSPLAHTLTATLATVSTTVPKFGTGSMAFSGASSGVSVGGNATDFNFGTGQFTVEGWGYFTSAPSTCVLASQWGNAGAGGQRSWWFGVLSGNFDFIYSLDGTTTPIIGGAAFVVTQNTWVHLAVDRDSNNLVRIYQDGVVKASATVASALFASTAACWMGNDTDPGVRANSADRFDDIRVTKGVARYAGAFTPPTAAFPDGGPCSGGGLMLLGVGSIAFPSPGLVAALAGARAILRNRPTTRRGLLRPW